MKKHDFSQIVKDLTDKCEWTQQQIADEVGCSQTHIQRLQEGVSSNPRYSLATALIELHRREMDNRRRRLARAG